MKKNNSALVMFMFVMIVSMILGVVFADEENINTSINLNDIISNDEDNKENNNEVDNDEINEDIIINYGTVSE